jgi:putative holliday junction resolvase
VSRTLGIDYGTVRIGLALSDPTETLASPLPHLENKTIPQIRDFLNELIQTHAISKIIVGLPRNMDGSYGPAAEKVRNFISQIQESLSTPIETQDERLTTVQASKQLSQMGLNQKELRKKIDSSSASLILQQYLDRKRLSP